MPRYTLLEKVTKYVRAYKSGDAYSDLLSVRLAALTPLEARAAPVAWHLTIRAARPRDVSRYPILLILHYPYGGIDEDLALVQALEPLGARGYLAILYNIYFGERDARRNTLKLLLENLGILEETYYTACVPRPEAIDYRALCILAGRIRYKRDLMLHLFIKQPMHLETYKTQLERLLANPQLVEAYNRILIGEPGILARMG